MGGIARWLRRADANGLHRTVHALEQQIEAPARPGRRLPARPDIAISVSMALAEGVGRQSGSTKASRWATRSAA